jgi:hypothetical protein
LLGVGGGGGYELGLGELLWKGTWEGERRKRRRWIVWKSKDECFGKLGGEQNLTVPKGNGKSRRWVS